MRKYIFINNFISSFKIRPLSNNSPGLQERREV